MTTLAAFLEDFASAPSAPMAEHASVFDEADLEGQKLEAFENGYRAGWDDAIKAQSEDHTRITSALGQHLQDLSFTYHEAFSHVMNAMSPLLEEITRVLLPEMARATLGQRIVEELQGHASEIGALEVQIALSPCSAKTVAPLLDQSQGFPVRIVEDDTLADEQADIRFGDAERQVDLSGLVAGVSEAVEGFTHENRRKVANG